MRALAVSVAVSVAAVGFLGTFAAEWAPSDRASSLSEGLRAGPGSHVLVRAYLERVRPVAGGAAVGTATDCFGTRADVFFPRGAGANASHTRVVLDASVALYRGKFELVVEDPDRMRPLLEPAAIVTPDELARTWRSHACHSVAVTGAVLWGHLSPDDGRDAELGLLTEDADLQVALHSEAFIELSLEAGVRATFVGIVAASAEGDGPVLHVRV